MGSSVRLIRNPIADRLLPRYRGLGVSMARSCILNAVFFSSYEYIKGSVNSFVGE